jgi:putative Holliday junction resolvase
LGLDVGARRIGMAVSDLLGVTAQGIETMERRNKRTDLQQIARVIRNYNIAAIVVGLPLRLSGKESAQTEKVTAFAEMLRERFQLPIHLWDERLTSVEANRLMREADLSIEQRAANVDRMAATLILQTFMDSRSFHQATK